MLIQLVNYPAQSSGSIVIKEKHQRRIVSEAMTVKSFSLIVLLLFENVISIGKCLRMLHLKFETKPETTTLLNYL